ncbi:MAG: preprotein translocase subunit SecA [Deltaproteobacteria bacterium]|nr:preprotein translocase subunit SecA [Deltaproteobacteria bacterium]
MLGSLIKKVVGTKNERELKRIVSLVDAMNGLEPQMRALTDAQLKAKTGQFKERLDQGQPLDELLVEAFAVCREAAVRTLGMRPFDVQLIGGVILHEGKIAEMKTGEGKTLAATLPVYLNALTGRGTHVVTVNDYLAQRDAEWMGQVYRFLGLSVGCVLNPMDDAQRRKAYFSDVTYGTNNEFGFDYLRDNMKFELESMAQREFYFAIVDEVDSILIDEARTPLIISGPAEKSTSLSYQVDRIIPRLVKEEDYAIDEKARSATLTESGVAKVEQLLKVDNLYDPRHIELLHHVQQALKAHSLFTKDVDYIVKSGQVVIVDEFTGRLMPGRRYSDGLHQALEAKERVKIESENQTLATITFQNYFRLYDKLAGMTGTADTEAVEFDQIYGLEVLVVPTHKKMIRKDNPDQIYRTQEQKYEAVLREIKACHDKKQPVLVGTVSVEKSELLAKKLKKMGLSCQVLNAKHHAREAEIVAQAGQPGAVTISTNMAGRGTDIVLGQGVTEVGGLHIIGTERHEARRIDNQLRGRSGRQGDPGSSRFFLSLEDDLLRIFGSDRVKGLLGKLGMDDGEPIEHNLITRGIENAQRRVEAHNFEIRKQLLEYDDVMNKQRQVIYAQRRMILEGRDLTETVLEMVRDLAEELWDLYTDPKEPVEDWDLKALSEALFDQFGLITDLDPDQVAEMGYDASKERLLAAVEEIYQAQEASIGPEIWPDLQKWVMLKHVDVQWKDHLLNMDHLKEGIGLRGYGQREPLKEYQREGFDLFEDMVGRIRRDTVRELMRVRLAEPEEIEEMTKPEQGPMSLSHAEEPSDRTVKRTTKKVGRNAPCPCGSGKKYKKCCMLKDQAA